MAFFFIPFTVVVVGKVLGNISLAYVKRRNDLEEEKFLKRALDGSALEKMDSDHDNKVTKAEFLLFILNVFGKCEEDEMKEILELFDKLDKDGSGTLTKEDLQFIPEATAKLHKEVVGKK